MDLQKRLGPMDASSTAPSLVDVDGREHQGADLACPAGAQFHLRLWLDSHRNHLGQVSK